MGKFKFKLLSMFLSLAVLFSPMAVFAEKEIIDVSREEVICRRYLSDVLIITTLPEYSLKMPDYERFGLRRPWWDDRNAIKEIRLDMFKSMNYRTFRDFRRLEIADLSKASELEDLGQETFLNCNKLAFLFLPETFEEKFYSIKGKVASEEECRKYYAINKNCQIKFGDLQRYTEKLEVENDILLQKYTEELIDKNNTLAVKIEKLEEELKKLQEKNIVLQKENSDSRSAAEKSESLEQENKELQEEILALSQNNIQIKSKVEILEKEIETLTNKFTEQEKQLKELQEKNMIMKKENSDSKSILANLEQLKEEVSVLMQSIIKGTELSADQGKDEKVGNITWFYNKDAKTLTINGHGHSMRDYITLQEVERLSDRDILPKLKFSGPAWRKLGLSVEHVKIRNMERIGGIAFAMSNLKSLDLPEGLKSIGKFAFFRNETLTTVKIPSSVETIESGAFSGCDLKSVDLPEGLKIIEENIFSHNRNLTTVKIPNSVEIIENGAFHTCDLGAVKLPEGLKRIGKIYDDLTRPWVGAFAMNASLRMVNIPSSVETIGCYAFENCGLKFIELPEGLKSIGKSAFFRNETLTTVKIPSSVETIGEYTFYGCNLTSVELPWGLKSIEKCTFAENKNLTTVKIPSTVETIGCRAFDRCGLTSVELPTRLKSIGEYAFYKCNLTSVELPWGLKSIEESTFAGNKNLTTVKIPSTVETIGRYAFKNCGLTSVELLMGLKIIGEEAFADNEKLTTVKIPSSVETVGPGVFVRCKALTNATIPEKFKGEVGKTKGVKIEYIK